MKAVGANLHGGAPTPSVEALVSSPSVMHAPPKQQMFWDALWSLAQRWHLSHFLLEVLPVKEGSFRDIREFVQPP